MKNLLGWIAFAIALPFILLIGQWHELNRR